MHQMSIYKIEDISMIKVKIGRLLTYIQQDCAIVTLVNNMSLENLVVQSVGLSVGRWHDDDELQLCYALEYVQ